MIEDDELREIYKVSSAEHLQNLESGLLELEKNPNNPELIHTLLREAHSLKGDSRVTGVKGVETLAHKIEEILGEVKNQQRKLTSEIGDRLYQVLDGMKKLVQEAVTGEPSHINHTELLNNLTSVLDKPSGKTNGNGNGDSKKVTNRFIEDEDLREIYHISSIQHLEKIKSGLILLEKNPEDSISLSELLEEAQSFELDSRIVGREDLESLIHRLEEILVGIKEHLIPFRQVSQKLNNSLEGIKELVNEAVTGETSNVDPLQLLEQLENLNTEETTENNTPEVQNRAGSNSLDTIRVPMRHLDSLLVHTGELTVTRTRMAHINEQIQELATVWEDWNNNKNRRQQYQEVLQRVISNLKTAAPENYTRLDLISRELDEKIRTLRLLPLSTVFLLFPRVVRDLAKEQGKEVELIIEGGDLTVDKQIIEEIKDPLMHLIRNAINNG